MSRQRFVTAINCIDGRAQLPALNWLKPHCNVDYVDLITEPGPDKILTRGPAQTIASIRSKATFSFEVHHSTVLAIVAHHDCIAHPVSREEHWEDIKQCVQVAISWNLWPRVLGLWVNEWGSVDLVCDKC